MFFIAPSWKFFLPIIWIWKAVAIIRKKFQKNIKMPVRRFERANYRHPFEGIKLQTKILFLFINLIFLRKVIKTFIWGRLWQMQKMWNASRFCVSSLRRGHANLLCIVPILVYVLPKQDKNRQRFTRSN